MNTTVMLVFGALLLVAFLLPLLAKRGAKAAPAVKAKPLMTASELAFLVRLEGAAPELRFHAQVAMGALLAPAAQHSGSGKGQRAAQASARNRYSQKIVDFVAQRRDTGQVIAIIELDDRSHRAERDARRDAMLQQAGYRTVRWQATARPSRAEIFATLMGPPPATPAAATSLALDQSAVGAG